MLKNYGRMTAGNVLEEVLLSLAVQLDLTTVLDHVACPTSCCELHIRRYPSQTVDQVLTAIAIYESS